MDKVVIVVIVLALILSAANILHTGTDEGIISAKWVESHSSSNGGSTTYYIQMTNGDVFSLLFGPGAFDQLLIGDHIKFDYRGIQFYAGSWRLLVPVITTYYKVEG